MKKVMAFMLVVTVIVSMFTIGASAVDNYQPKEITLVVNEDGCTCSLPEGTVVYLGDTIKIPRDELIFFGDFIVKDTGETETDLALVPGAINLYRGDDRIASDWGGEIIFSEEGVNPDFNWYSPGESPTKPGKYRIEIYEWHDASWKIYEAEKDELLITFDVVDPKTVDEIVVPGSTPATSSSEAPTESSEAPVESTEAPVESTEAPTTESKAPTTESKAPVSSEADADTEPAKGNAWLWIILAVVAVVVIVVIIVVAKKKKK